MKGITFGQYYKVDSVIHELDPRVKLFGTLIFVVTLFFPTSYAGLGVAALALIAVLTIAKIPFFRVMRGIRPVLTIIIFSGVVNLFFTDGHVIWRLGILHITKEGIKISVYLVLRLIMLIMGSSIMTYTTTPSQLTNGLEKSFGFLVRFHVPVHELAMMMAIAMRFIPILQSEFDRVKMAQMSRGADFENGNLIQKGKKMIPLLIPLFVAAIRKAGDLAFAMDARCYRGGHGRTRLHPLAYVKRDYIAYGIIGTYLAVMIILAVIL